MIELLAQNYNHPAICFWGIPNEISVTCESEELYQNLCELNQLVTEEYQAYYHHEMLKTFASRPYLWATHCWNMFDFAADSRDEGGCKGRNNKGLVTYDRKIKKEAFFIYKAYWTQTPMIHVCGERFVDRAPNQRNITVYTNCDSVTLVVNNTEIASAAVVDHAAVFKNVNLEPGENIVTAYSGETRSNTITLRAVDEPNETYILPKDETVAGNWFDDISPDAALEFPDGYFNIKDTVGSLMEHPETNLTIQDLFDRMFAGQDTGQEMKQSIEMCRDMALEPLLVISKAPKGTDAYLNEKLNKIPKE